MAIEYHFTVPGTDYVTLFPSATPEPQWPEDGGLAYAYVRGTLDWTELSIPFACLTSGTRGAGVSFAPDLGHMPIRPFEIPPGAAWNWACPGWLPIRHPASYGIEHRFRPWLRPAAALR